MAYFPETVKGLCPVGVNRNINAPTLENQELMLGILDSVSEYTRTTTPFSAQNGEVVQGQLTTLLDRVPSTVLTADEQSSLIQGNG